MPTLTLTDRHADELQRLAYLEAADLLRQAANGLQTAAESASAISVHKAGEGLDLDMWIEQARDALNLLDAIEPNRDSEQPGPAVR